MNTVSTTTAPTEIMSYRDTILRAAGDPTFDVAKLERLIAVQEGVEQRTANLKFNVALAAAQAEMRPVLADSTNPQTRSKYASFSKLDEEVRPIYTAHGFSVTFNTDVSPEPSTVMITATLGNGMVSRHYSVPMPIDTKGARGQDVMTRTHATMSAITYGKRALLVMMFNLAIDQDDDGNAAGGRVPARGAAIPKREVAPPPVPEANLEVDVNPAGETTEIVKPFVIEWLGADGPREWGMKFIACLRSYCRTLDDVDGFTALNNEHLERMMKEAGSIYSLMTNSVNAIRSKYLEAKETPT